MFTEITENIPLPERMNNPFYYQPTEVCRYAVALVQEEIRQLTDEQGAWSQFGEEINGGKMFGVLVVKDREGRLGFLKAYSGQIGGREDWEEWVPAVFDYLQPDGYFKTKEQEISNLNKDIEEREVSPILSSARSRLVVATKQGEQRINEYRVFMAEAKRRREEKRANGLSDENALQRESQFQKAELRRLRLRVAADIEPLRNVVSHYEHEINVRKQQRHMLSDHLQRWLFSQFVMLNGKGSRETVLNIFNNVVGKDVIPPSGTGECCAPKLLQYAFANGYQIVSMAEFWWGKSPVGELRTHLDYYPACQGKCRPLLDFMLQGVDVQENVLEREEERQSLSVLYEDEWLVAVNKPAGMLAVPGKGSRRSALDIVQGMISENKKLFAVHRLDMQTSGILLFAKDAETQKAMFRLFSTREVHKRYIAVLEGEYMGNGHGEICLPLSADYLNRPRQCVNHKEGKESVTEYEVLRPDDDGYDTFSLNDITGRTVVALYPHTGRTHQLRVHCAHPDGLGIPIVGDDLYGHHAERLLLHAERISFIHPVNGQKVYINAQANR